MNRVCTRREQSCCCLVSRSAWQLQPSLGSSDPAASCRSPVGRKDVAQEAFHQEFTQVQLILSSTHEILVFRPLSSITSLLPHGCCTWITVGFVRVLFAITSKQTVNRQLRLSNDPSVCQIAGPLTAGRPFWTRVRSGNAPNLLLWLQMKV